ncbi:glycosyltransferase, partial [Synechococcus sp. AH-558-M21]|nr:glycosyltransferase [Synechococcus sp. AH-558-M21]
EWRKLKTVADADNRIKLIDKKLNREEIINLYGCSDTLISLHRAEGFGRILAESLMLGLDVVATNYSGNTDFCIGANAYPIDYDLTLIAEGEYVHSKNQYWAEPNIDHAARILYNLYKNHRGSTSLRRNKYFREVLQTYCDKFSANTVGLNYKKRLVQIWNISKNERPQKLRWDYSNCLYEI